MSIEHHDEEAVETVERTTALPSFNRRAFLALMLQSAGGVLLAADTPADKIQKFLESIKDSYPKLVEALDHDDFDIREGAQTILIARALAEISKTKQPFAHRDALVLKEKRNDLEQERRLKQVIEAIDQKEQGMTLEIASIFKAPAEWNRIRNTETIEHILKTVARETGQPLSLQHTAPALLKEPASTQGLDGKTLWQILNTLTGSEGGSIHVSSNHNGHLYVLRCDDRHLRRRETSGPINASLKIYESWPEKVQILFEAEPIAQLTGWRIDHLTIRHGNMEDRPLFLRGKLGEGNDFISVTLPPATMPGDTATIEFTCTFRATVSKKEIVTDLKKEQEFGNGYCVRTLPIRKTENGYVLAAQYLPDIHDTALPKIGFVVIGPDGLPMIPLKMENHTGIGPRLMEWTYPGEPKRIEVMLPQLNREVAASHTFVFKDLPLVPAREKP